MDELQAELQRANNKVCHTGHLLNQMTIKVKKYSEPLLPTLNLLRACAPEEIVLGPFGPSMHFRTQQQLCCLGSGSTSDFDPGSASNWDISTGTSQYHHISIHSKIQHIVYEDFFFSGLTSLTLTAILPAAIVTVASGVNRLAVLLLCFVFFAALELHSCS